MENWTIFPTDDETVFFLAQHHTELSKLFKLTTPHWDIVKFAYNKTYSYKLAEKIGIPIPKTFYPEKLEDLFDRDISFPAIIKPSVMRRFFSITGKKVRLYHRTKY